MTRIDEEAARIWTLPRLESMKAIAGLVEKSEACREDEAYAAGRLAGFEEGTSLAAEVAWLVPEEDMRRFRRAQAKLRAALGGSDV